MFQMGVSGEILMTDLRHEKARKFKCSFHLLSKLTTHFEKHQIVEKNTISNQPTILQIGEKLSLVVSMSY